MSDYKFKSIPDMIRTNAKVYGEKPAISYKKQGNMITLSYAHFYERILMAARGLMKAGVQKGEPVAILSENRAGWVIADLGIQCAGGVTVPIYATNMPDQVAYVVNHCQARIVFVSSRSQYEKLLEVRDQISNVEFVVSIERFMWNQDLPLYTLFQLSEISHPMTDDDRGKIDQIIDNTQLEDMISIIYTSGTTGVPKGVMLTHENILSNTTYGAEKVAHVDSSDVMLSFLPLSHVFERTVGYYMTLSEGAHMVFAESIEKVPENMLEVRPTVMISVPRLFEKIHSRIYEMVHKMSPLKSKLFHTAMDIGYAYIQRKYVEKKSTGMLGVKYRIADRIIFKKLRNRFGGRVKFFASGGAPLDKTVNEFFWAIGLPILEGYGLTETSPMVTMNTMEESKFGSIGTPLKRAEVKLAEDGELLTRGPMVMKGYYKNPEATAENIDADGWFKTGDIAKIDDDGFVYIVDRKKEIIVTAGGKNIPPQPIENELKLDKFISQAFVCGNKRPYLVALVVPNVERLIDFARERNINYLDIDDLVSHERIKRLMDHRIEAVNEKLPTYETIKRIHIVPRDFSIEGGELTPTLKLKRKVIHEKYKSHIDKLYDE